MPNGNGRPPIFDPPPGETPPGPPTFPGIPPPPPAFPPIDPGIPGFPTPPSPVFPPTIGGLPLPTPPLIPVPFPMGPAANDPFIPPAAKGIILRGAGSVIIGGVFAIEVLKQIGIERIEQREREFEAVFQTRVRRARARQERREIILPDFLPDEVGEPDPIALPGRPAPELLPEIFPEGVPAIEPAPVIIPAPAVPLPEIDPGPIQEPAPLPAPSPTPSTAPSTRPRRAPTRSPASLPGLFGLPRFLPFGFPRFSLRPGTALRPQLRPGDLTPIDPVVPLSTPPIVGSIQLPGQAPFPQPRTQTQRRCKEVKRRRRRKGKCREGFFKEFPGKTRFTEWREVDCVTRDETRKSKLARKGFDVGNIESFPKLGI